MIYKSTSVKETIGKIIRNTRLTDSSYINDLLEWIPEAMAMLRTENELESLYSNLYVKDHCAKLPCGILSLDAVLYSGYRLREGSTVANVKSMPTVLDQSLGTPTSIFIPDTDLTIQNTLYNRVTGADLKGVDFSSGEFYKLQMDYIQTSFIEGNIQIYYHKMPTDKEGYPLIPDNDNYKEALYWYSRMKMIEAGWEDPLFDWNHCWEMWEHIYAPRAINEIRYPSVDRMERLLRSLNRLIPPSQYYTDFFVGAEQYQDVRTRFTPQF